MSESSTPRNSGSWFGQHASALFLAALVILSLFLLLTGMALQSSAQLWMQTAGSVLLQLSGGALAAAVAATFLSFADVRSQLAATVTKLISEGGVVKVLSPDARARLREETILANLAPMVDRLDPSLLSHLEGLSHRCLSMPIASNCVINRNYTDWPQNDLFLECDCTMNYRLSVRHLERSCATIPYRIVHEMSLFAGHALTTEDILLRFECRFGDQIFGKDCCDITTIEQGRIPIIRTVFSQHIEVVDELDVSLAYTLLIPKKDNSTLQFARFPTSGFHVTVSYSADYEYDGTWLKSGEPNFEFQPGRNEVLAVKAGLTASTNDWILPGEGIAISWSKKIHSIAHSEQAVQHGQSSEYPELNTERASRNPRKVR